MEIKERLIKVVGEENFSDRKADLEFYAKDFSLSPLRMPNYLARPKNSEEVSQIVKLANEVNIPVVPVSSQVHFYGSAIPSQGGIMLDLGRMEQILEVDQADRLVRLEAGVTWEKLQSELANLGFVAMEPLIPHSGKSVLTTWLEREVPVNPRYEFGEPLTSMEVVWPNGDIFRVGSASTPGVPETSPAKGGNPQGPGMDWYRLLQGAQGTMGVVTWGVIKFEHLPRLSKAFFIPFEKLDEAIQPLYRIQRRMIGNECFLLDRVNLATILADDWPADFKPLIKSLPEWSLILILSGAPRRPEEKIAYEEKALREIGAQFPGIALLDSLPGVPRAERELPELLRKPWTKDKTYWKHRLKGGSQDLFFIAKLSKIPEMAERVNQLAQKFDYPSDEIGGYIQPIEQGRACHGEFNFYFDPNSPDEVAKCQALYFESAKSLFEAGAHFSRPYGILAEIVYQKATSYTIMLKKVKNIFDPHNIMNPGKLCF